MTLTVKLGLAFAALAATAALPGVVLLLGVAQLRSQTRQSLVELAGRDGCLHAQKAVTQAAFSLEHHAIFPHDARFQEAARAGLAAAEEAVGGAALGQPEEEAEALRAESAALRAAAAPLLAPAPSPGGKPASSTAVKDAALALGGHLDRLIGAANEGLARRGARVASTVDRLAYVGELGLLATAAAAAGLAVAMGGAWRRRMSAVREAVERVGAGDLGVRIGDREEDEVGALARAFNGMVGELAILEDMKSQFVAVASHELRTPLTLIDGYCGILLSAARGPLTDWQRQRIELIHQQVTELLGLMQDLLDAERLQARALAPVLEPVEPEAVAAGVVESFEASARGKGLSLRLSVGPGAPRSGTADVRALTRVLRNLVDNAVKYTDGGEVEVSLHGDGETLVLAVRDTGRGISPDNLPRVFGRFVQIDDGGPRRGFGLGLSIVKGLVERNGGRIQAESRPGKGSLFTVTWPMRGARSVEAGA